MRRMATGGGAFESPDLGALSRNLKQNFPTLENFSGASEVAEFSKKKRAKSQVKFQHFEMNLT
mgnify:CR=1 FL=1